MAEALLSLGGNVGDARATLARAVAMLCDGSDVILVARSSDYRTAPWGVTDQPSFVNLALVVRTRLAPRALLERARQVETALGRDRAGEQRWGPRAVDIDIIAYDGLTLEEQDLQLPHPRALERAFVLVPLAEIAPERTIAGVAIREAAERLDHRGVERLPPARAPEAAGSSDDPLAGARRRGNFTR